LPNEPIWLPVEVVVEHNRLELADTGEHHVVRDLGLLESALARPHNAFAYGEEDIVVLAVTLMAGFPEHTRLSRAISEPLLPRCGCFCG
jgi:death-on-curing protein